MLQPKSYEFGYAVKDDYTGNDYKRQETSDGNQVKGEYRVQLPDGRTQIVTYYADWQTGFHADVRYEGTASYPEKYNTYGGGGGYQAGGGYQGGFQGGYQGGFQAAGHGGFQGVQGGHGGFQGGHGGAHQDIHHGSQGAHHDGIQGGHINTNLNAPSNQYGAPFVGSQPSNQYGAPNTGFGPASSSVTIKDFSGPGTPYNVNPGYGQPSGHHTDVNHGYDSYAHAGNFGNKPKPSTAYGVP